MTDDKDMRAGLGKITAISNHNAIFKTFRKAVVGLGKILNKKSTAQSFMSGIEETIALCERETSTWQAPAAVENGTGGAFDGLDLRHWLALAERCGVPYVPARQILTLQEDELMSIQQRLVVPEFIARANQRRAQRNIPEIMAAAAKSVRSDIEQHEDRIREQEMGDRVFESTFKAMEDVPAGWMVRSNLSGSSMLKTLAGSGMIRGPEDTAGLGADIEVGAGFVRVGNRFRIDATDARFSDCFANGHRHELHFLARPWMPSARNVEMPDPHRHGTVFAGKGTWPMEWRCFVQGGRVTGVAAYYGWVGSVTPENARMALEAVDLAQRMVDEATRIQAWPRLLDLELMRAARGSDPAELKEVIDLFNDFPRDAVSCTLDFLEVEGRGLMFLEGGPPHTPIGGGHPCAFAGFGASKETGRWSKTEGVALKIMDHVILADPGTWMDDPDQAVILSFEDARLLALDIDDSPSP